MENDIISKIKAADQAKKNALRGLHKELGYPTAQALADAIVEAAEAPPAPKQPKASAGSSAGNSAGTTVKKASGSKRPRISEETKQAIGEALKAGEPGNQLTTRFGVSYGIIHQIKTKLGLVSKKKASKRR
jgi:hypothetical protein